MSTESLRYLALTEHADSVGVETLLSDLLGQTFAMPKGSWEAYAAQVGRENFRLLLEGDEPVAGLGILHTHQYFGGRAIPAACIAAVGVRAEMRGRGYGFELMKRTLSELREKSIPLSVLYASTCRLYRKLGYEQAGHSNQYRVATEALHGGGASWQRGEVPPAQLRSVDPTRHELFQEVHRAAARETNGFLERTPGLWTRISRTLQGVVYAYVAGPENAPEGYVVYEQVRMDSGVELRARDWIARTPAARRAFLDLFSGHRSTRPRLLWFGPANDSWLTLQPEQDAVVAERERWLLRLVDVERALAARGYAPEVAEVLDLRVEDSLLAEPSRSLRLTVRDGQGLVKPIASAEVRLDVRSLAPLFSGLHSAEELASLGWIEGPAELLAAATRIFRGPEPWMADRF